MSSDGAVQPTSRARYKARYWVVNDDGDPLFDGHATINSTRLDLDTDPQVTAIFHAITARTIRADCDRLGGVPAGRVVITAMREM